MSCCHLGINSAWNMVMVQWSWFRSVILFIATWVTVNSAQAALSCQQLFEDSTAQNEIVYADEMMYWPIDGRSDHAEKVINHEMYTAFIGENTKPVHYDIQFGYVELTNNTKYKVNRSAYFHKSYKKFDEQIKMGLKQVFQTYVDRNIVSKSYVQNMMKVEKNLLPNRKVYFISSNPYTKEPLEFIRLYDGSPENQYAFKFGFEIDRPIAKLPIENNYPHITLPERLLSHKGYVIELGRLFKHQKIIETNLEHLFYGISQFIHRQHLAHNYDPMTYPTIYIEATPVGRRLYKRYGFEDAFTPDQLGSENYVLKIGSKKFVDQFANSYKHKPPTFKKEDQVKNRKTYYEKLNTWAANNTQMFNKPRQTEYLFEKFVSSLGGFGSDKFWSYYFSALQRMSLGEAEMNYLQLQIQKFNQGNSTVVYSSPYHDITLFRLQDADPNVKLIPLNQNMVTNVKTAGPKTYLVQEHLFRLKSKEEILYFLQQIKDQMSPDDTLIIQEPFKNHDYGQFFWYEPIDRAARPVENQIFKNNTYYWSYATDLIRRNLDHLQVIKQKELKILFEKAGLHLKNFEPVLDSNQILYQLKKK